MKRSLAFAFVLSAAAAAAHADKATDKYQSGLAHYKAQEFAAACADFQESESLDPSGQAEYYLGRCALQEGHPARAWNFFKRAAAGLTDAGERGAAEQAASDLVARIGRVTLVGTEPAPGLEVRIDAEVVTSQVLLGQPFAVEPGAHTLTATAPDRTEWRRDFTIAQGESLSFNVPNLPSGGDTTATPPASRNGGFDAAEPSTVVDEVTVSSGSGRKKLAYVAIGVGGAGLATGAVFGLLARSKWADAKAGCEVVDAAYVACPAGADDLRAQASTRATISTAAFIVGGVAVAGGVVLYLTAPKERQSIALAPTASSRGVGVALTGSF